MIIDFRKARFFPTEDCVYMAHPQLPVHKIRLSGIDELVTDELKPTDTPYKHMSFERWEELWSYSKNEPHTAPPHCET